MFCRGEDLPSFSFHHCGSTTVMTIFDFSEAVSIADRASSGIRKPLFGFYSFNQESYSVVLCYALIYVRHQLIFFACEDFPTILKGLDFFQM